MAFQPGTLALVGSGEFELWTEESDRFLLSRATGDGSVAILPLASAPEGRAFADWAHKGLEHNDSKGGRSWSGPSVDDRSLRDRRGGWRRRGRIR